MLRSFKTEFILFLFKRAAIQLDSKAIFGTIIDPDFVVNHVDHFFNGVGQKIEYNDNDNKFVATCKKIINIYSICHDLIHSIITLVEKQMKEERNIATIAPV
jgi:hypothetical protein